MAYRLRFNGYDFPAGMRPVGGDGALDLAEQEVPRRAGSVTQTGRKKSRVLQIRGAFTGASADAIQTTFDAMRAACATGVEAALYFGRDDRYIMAKLEREVRRARACDDACRRYELGERRAAGRIPVEEIVPLPRMTQCLARL